MFSMNISVWFGLGHIRVNYIRLLHQVQVITWFGSVIQYRNQVRTYLG